MNADFFAHVAEDGREQTVVEHLEGTAQRCACFALAFGAERQGQLIGLAHDIGKCSDAFQRRLHGGPVVDHAAAGAWECAKADHLWAAFCVAGHHGGLPDAGNARNDRADDPTLFGRLWKAKCGTIPEYELPLPLPNVSPPAGFGNDRLRNSFLIRMRHLLNTLFVTSEDVYLSLDGENVVANREKQQIARWPLHTLQGIVCFSYSGTSPTLMGACAQRDICLSFCTPRGRFLARTAGVTNGNVLLRRTQYRMADDPLQSCRVARCMIFGKLYYTRWSLERVLRDHRPRVSKAELREAAQSIAALLPQVLKVESPEELRGLEGSGAKAYFSVFDQMILREKEQFSFHGRNRRPPTDNVNAMLSFAYSLLANDCASALESVGLDAYVGFLHGDRPGRKSLALDLMEELRPCVADRFVLTAINNRIVSPADYTKAENGAVQMNDDGRKRFLKAWQERKQEQLTHPYLREKLPWGLVPYVQALLLARYIRGDLDEYPPFLWK